MIPVVILAGIALAGITLAAFYKEIAIWLKHVYKKLPNSIKDNLQGAKSFLEKMDRTIKNVFYYYSFSQKNQKWTETVVSREVDQSSIPKDILEKIQNNEKVDITNDIERELKLSLVS